MSLPGLVRLDSRDSEFDRLLDALLDRETEQDIAIEATVREIINAIRKGGDRALIDYTSRLDRLVVESMKELELSPDRIEEIVAGVDPAVAAAIDAAARRIRAYHEREVNQSWRHEEADGTVLGQNILPLDRVGVYVPGGRAAYPSSVLMTVLPARVAGVGEVIMTVPTPGGEVNAAVIYAATVAGVDRIFTIGGAQAIAALAYGTATVPGVDKIVGPGNSYVATAKKLVFGKVGIDMIAGPSEVAVICDDSVDPDWVAMDLFAQSEHDEMAQSIAITDSVEMAERIMESIERLLPEMERADIIRAALNAQGAIITVPTLSEAAEVANRIAPEHLELMVAEPEALIGKIRHAGAIFSGRFSAESLGDYCAGPNHVLPTAGTARFSSPLGVYDFQKRSSVIQASAAGASEMASIASVLARCEGLTAHARSAEYRLSPGPVAASKQKQSSLREVLVPEVIRRLAAYHVPSADGLLKLDAMENPWPLPVALRDDWLARLAEVSFNRYPDPAASELVMHIRRVFGVPETYGVVLGNGSDELIQMLAQMVGGPGRTFLAPSPSFSMYSMISAMTGTAFEGVPLDENFQVNRELLLERIRESAPACVFLAFPNNPTGNSFDRETILKVIDTAPGLVVVDEAYFAFSGDSLLSEVASYNNLLVMRTLSKSGLAGLRLGMLFGQPEWTNELDKVRLPYNINSLTQASAIFCLEHYDVFEAQTRRIVANRATLLAQLDAIEGLTVFPSVTNFILVRIHGDGSAVWSALKERGILVKNLHQSGDPLENCLRLTVGTEEEVHTLVTTLQDLLG